MATLEEALQAELQRRNLMQALDAERVRRASQDNRRRPDESREQFMARIQAERGDAQLSSTARGAEARIASGIQAERDQAQLSGPGAILARTSAISRGIPFAGSWIDEGLNAIQSGAGDYLNRTDEAFRRNNPGAALGYGLVGTGLSVGATMGAAPGAVSRLPQMSRGAQALAAGAGGAVAGATEGAIYGAGDQSGEGRAANAGTNAAVGGLFGAGAGLVAPYAAEGVRAVLGRLQRSDVATIAATLGITRSAAVVVRNALEAGGLDAAEEALRRAGPDAMLADASGATRDLLDASVNAGGPAGQITRDAVNARTQAATENMTGALDNALGRPQGLEAMQGANRQGTAPARQAAYDAAYSAAIDYSGSEGRALEGLLGRVPASAWRRADQLMQLEGMESLQRLIRFGDDGTVEIIRMPDVRQLDYITRALNDVAEEANGQGRLGGTTDLGRLTGNLSRAIRQNLRRAVPEYGRALDTAASAIDHRNALDLGYNMLRSNTRRDEFLESISGMGQAERRAVGLGLRSSIDDTLANVRRTITDPDTTTREGIQLLRDLSSRANQEKMRVLLGPAEADRLLGEIDAAATAFELRAAIATNSRTAARQAIQGSVEAQTGDGIVRTLASGEPINATKRLVQAITGETAEARELRRMGLYEEIATALTGVRGSEAQRALRIIRAAMSGQDLSDGQARMVANALTSAGVLGAGPTARQTLLGR